MSDPFLAEPPEHQEGPWRVVAAGDRTDGMITVGEARLPARSSGPSLHVHTHEDEGTFVIEGTLTFVIGDNRFEAGPGSFVWAPRGVPHTFANLTEAPVRVIGMIVPSGLEKMFIEQAKYFSELTGPPDPERVDEIGSRYGVKVIGPPIDVS